MLEKRGTLRSLAATEEDSVYRLYYDFEQPLSRLQGHQILAINRGEKEKMLSATVLLERELALPLLRRAVVKPGSAAMGFVKSSAEDTYDRLIYPSLEREMRALLTERADEGAIGQFALNLKPLLMQPPVKGKVTMGLDPGYRMGCKVAVVDSTGKVLDTAAVYPTHGERQKSEAIAVLSRLIRKHGVEHIAIGNGTAGRETEQMAVELIRRVNGSGANVSYMIVSEAGGVRVLGEQARRRGIPAVRCEPPLGGVDRAALAGPARRACEDRSQGHRRGAVSARYAAKAARRSAQRCDGGLRQRRGRGHQHGLFVSFAARFRPGRDHSKKRRRIPRGKRRVHLAGPDQKCC